MDRYFKTNHGEDIHPQISGKLQRIEESEFARKTATFGIKKHKELRETSQKSSQAKDRFSSTHQSHFGAKSQSRESQNTQIQPLDPYSKNKAKKLSSTLRNTAKLTKIIRRPQNAQVNELYEEDLEKIQESHSQGSDLESDNFIQRNIEQVKRGTLQQKFNIRVVKQPHRLKKIHTFETALISQKSNNVPLNLVTSSYVPFD